MLVKRMKPGRIILIILPVVFLAYVMYANISVVSLSDQSKIAYTIDLGAENDTFGNAKLNGPTERISEFLSEESSSTTYRELRNNLVYFQVTTPEISNYSKVQVKVRFKNNFPDNHIFRLGAQNQEEWSHAWKTLYDPFYTSLYENFPQASNDNGYCLYIVNGKKIDFKASEFVEYPPAGSTIVVEEGIKVNANSQLSTNKSKSLEINTTLRGGHTFYTYIENESLEFAISKQDLNWYEGSDELKLTVYSTEDGDEKGNITIPDDGDISSSHTMGPLQAKSISLPYLSSGLYRIVIKADQDIYIQNITTTQDKLIVEKKLFYIPPADFYTEVQREETIGFLTYHESAYQDIHIQNNTLSAFITIDKKGVQYKTIVPPSKDLYRISSPTGDMIMSSRGYFAFTRDSYFTPFRCELLNLKKDIDWLKNNNIDYILVSSPDLIYDDDWIIAKAEWNLDELYIKDDTVFFVTNTQHFKDYPNNTIPIDWIKIDIF